MKKDSFDAGGDTMGVQMQLDLKKKLEILSDAAKYEVACSSSGVDRGG